MHIPLARCIVFNAYQVLAFVDDEPGKWNMHLSGLPVLSWEKMLEGGGKFGEVEEVILAVTTIGSKRKQAIADDCLRRQWKLKVMRSEERRVGKECKSRW